ncbi:MAG: DNA polymerase III subunit alpha, partial [Flavobacteriales bacterium]|nr:DNA polymerase III subunit alpha [Flavobacteriales bacterium]
MLLNCHSWYSLRYGTVEPGDLIQLARNAGYECIALTDINCTAGIIEYVRLAAKAGIRPVAGIDFRDGARQAYVGLARNNEGFFELNAHLSKHLHGGPAPAGRAPAFEHAFVIYPFSRVMESLQSKDATERNTYTDLAANEYIGVSLRDLALLRYPPGKLPADKLVFMHPVSFRHKRDFNTHRLLRAIDNNTLLSKLPLSEQGFVEDQWQTESEFRNLLGDYAWLMDHAGALLSQCEINLEFGAQQHHKNQHCYTDSEEGDIALLKKLCAEGLHYRYPDPDQQVLLRIEKELEIIVQKKFVSYFLINWKILSYARSRDYYYVGRGSGANSVIAYILRITDVDPIELDLYFERFINLFRQNPPDFDIDFSWKDREDITNFIFNTFPNVSLLGAFVTFQYSAVVRELGKVFGLPKHDIDMLSDGKFSASQLDSMHQLVLQYAGLIRDFPNYVSIHAAGILITEKPVHYYGATFLPPKGFATVQFDMNQAEDIAIYKFDILSQRGLGKIKDAVELVQQNHPELDALDIHDIKRFKNDPACNLLLTEARALGCFYVESPAMRMLLTKLRTHDYLGLVAASSVIRPGVASSGMMRQYILRERFPERRQDAPSALLELMPETYGVMVYQEDVIKVAHYFAGLSLGEADVLRRGMSGKFRGREEFERAKEQFHVGAMAKGHSPELVKEIWRQTESFAGYAFAKGHSASYAVESYQCLFLKAYYPLEYMVACINNYGGFYRTEIYVHEARLHGGLIEAPCVNTSGHGAVIFGNVITLGMEIIKELEVETRVQLLKAREDGPFASLDDFLNRVKISLDQCVLLARIGAFRFLRKEKKEILWNIHLRLSKTKSSHPVPQLFSQESKQATLPPLEHHWLEDAYDELELIGFPLCNPFDLINEELEANLMAREFKDHIGKEVTAIGYYVTVKPTRTSRGERMYFGNFLDREGQFIDTVHFPPVAAQYPLAGWGLFLITGKVTEEFDALQLEVTS